jgi:hypothetical protein
MAYADHRRIRTPNSDAELTPLLALMKLFDPSEESPLRRNVKMRQVPFFGHAS